MSIFREVDMFMYAVYADYCQRNWCWVVTMLKRCTDDVDVLFLEICFCVLCPFSSTLSSLLSLFLLCLKTPLCLNIQLFLIWKKKLQYFTSLFCCERCMAIITILLTCSSITQYIIRVTVFMLVHVMGVFSTTVTQWNIIKDISTS